MALVDDFLVRNDGKGSKRAHLSPVAKEYTIHGRWNFNHKQRLKTTKQTQIRKAAFQAARPLAGGTEDSHLMDLCPVYSTDDVSVTLEDQLQQKRTPPARQHLASQIVFAFDALAYGLFILGIVSLVFLWGSMLGKASHSPIFFLTLVFISLMVSSAFRKAAKSLRSGSKFRA